MSVAFLRNFTAKRLHSIAQGFNPGSVDIKRALKAPDLGTGGTIITPSSEQTTSGAAFPPSSHIPGTTAGRQGASVGIVT